MRKGRVERIEDASDRRVVACELTPAGREDVDRFLRIGHMRIEAIANALTLEELEAVVPVMEILSDAIDRQDEADSSARSEGEPGERGSRGAALVAQ